MATLLRDIRRKRSKVTDDFGAEETYNKNNPRKEIFLMEYLHESMRAHTNNKVVGMHGEVT